MKNETSKAVYSKPNLTEYGAVRNLTGGSGTMMMDGATVMAQI
jgi:hypothetical protein